MTDIFVLSAGILLGSALYTDLGTGKIPNGLTLFFACAGICLHLSGAGQGGAVAMKGLGTGLAVFMVPYALGGTGAGDVKLFGALGALLGPLAVCWIFLYSALFAGGVCLFRIARIKQSPLAEGFHFFPTARRNREISPTFAYTGPAVLGYLSWTVVGGLF